MKKILMIMLTLTLVLSMPTMVFAKENSTSITENSLQSTSNVSSISPKNIDYYTFPSQILDGYKTVSVKPGSGEALKMHVYLSSGSLTVWVKSASSSTWSKKATWNTIGHHYCDLSTKTNGGTYQIRLFGAASWFEGGIYTGI